MSYSIDTLKGQISAGGGVARANNFRVVLPFLPKIYVNRTSISIPTGLQLDVLCKSVTMPGRQLLTLDRQIGVVNQRVVYGFAVEDINLTFMGLNNYVVRKYFEDWQFFAMNQDTHDMKYKTDYAADVTVHALDQKGRTVYSVVLEEAFPVQILNVDFSNDNPQPVEVNVTLAYTKWRRKDGIIDLIGDFAEDVARDIITEIIT